MVQGRITWANGEIADPDRCVFEFLSIAGFKAADYGQEGLRLSSFHDLKSVAKMLVNVMDREDASGESVESQEVQLEDRIRFGYFYAVRALPPLSPPQWFT